MERSGLRYVAIGDSLARGFSLGLPRLGNRDGCDIRMLGVPLRWFDRPEVGYPRLLAERLARETGLTVALDDALTCSGARASTWWGPDDAPTPGLLDVIHGGVDLVTVTLGANDLLPRWMAYVPVRQISRRLGLRGAIVDRWVGALAPKVEDVLPDARAVEQRLGALLRWMRRSLACPICVTTYYGGEDNTTIHQRFVRPLNDAIVSAAASATDITVVDLVPPFAGRGGDASRWRRLVDSGDRLHPTTAGQLVIANTIADRLPRLPARRFDQRMAG